MKRDEGGFGARSGQRQWQGDCTAFELDPSHTFIRAPGLPGTVPMCTMQHLRASGDGGGSDIDELWRTVAGGRVRRCRAWDCWPAVVQGRLGRGRREWVRLSAKLQPTVPPSSSPPGSQADCCCSPFFPRTCNPRACALACERLRVGKVGGG
jgi:hypothetical protein